MKTALSIAGSDPSGGAGIQADLKTMTMHGVYAMSAVTALTAQNTTGVRGVLECAPEFLALQLDCIFSDIVPDAVKTGMVSSAPLIRVIADRLTHYRAQNLVVDPVMVFTSGSRLLEEEALEALRGQLLPWPSSSPPISRRRRSSPAGTSETDRTWRRQPGSSATPAAAPCCARGDTPSRTPTMCFMTGDGCAGSGGSDRQPQHPRHRLYPLLRHRRKPGPGPPPGGVRGPGQGLPLRRSARHAGSGRRLRSPEPRIPSDRTLKPR